jgi:hypothetical protein
MAGRGKAIHVCPDRSKKNPWMPTFVDMTRWRQSVGQSF